MKYLLLAFVAPALFFSVNIYAQTVPIERDFNIWNEFSVTFPVKKGTDKKGKKFDRITFALLGSLRFGRNVSRPVDERIGFNFSYRVNKFISLTPGYLYRGYQPYRGRIGLESRYSFAVNIGNKWKKFSINDRNQLEYQAKNSRKDAIIYRNLFRFNYPLIKNKKEILTLFVSNEPYYDFREKQVMRNELFAGFNKTFNKYFNADFFYLLVGDRSNPKTVNGFGVNLKFRVE
jgi:hypothetical protein